MSPHIAGFYLLTHMSPRWGFGCWAVTCIYKHAAPLGLNALRLAFSPSHFLPFPPSRYYYRRRLISPHIVASLSLGVTENALGKGQPSGV